MKKKVILSVVIIILLVLLVPIPMKLKDGGSIRFQALLYSVTKYHKLDHTTNYVDGIGIEILGMEIFNSTKYTETQTETIERRKIKDVQILNSKDINTKELAKFNGIVYGRSNAIIDYAGNLDNYIGTINFLIDEDYLPEINGETNNEKLLNTKVLEANAKTMVLNIDNEAVLFEAAIGDNINKVSNNDNEE